MNNGSQVIVRPARNVRGSVRLPGDKSISHRYAMLAGIAEGSTSTTTPAADQVKAPEFVEAAA